MASRDTANPPVAMTIAGSDSSGGAGIQADLKTFTALGVYGASVITALTAQNTTGVQGVHAVPPAFVAEQIRSVVSDVRVGAIKTGMLADAGIIRTVVAELAGMPEVPLVVDPVMVATSGDPLLAPEAVACMRDELVPHAALITPNLPEAAVLIGGSVATTLAEAHAQIAALAGLGAKAVLLKGGHGIGTAAVDLLHVDGRTVEIAGPRVETQNTHGTGCTLSAAIAAMLATGHGLEAAVRGAKAYLGAAIAGAAGQRLGKGHGPVDHLHALRRWPAPCTFLTRFLECTTPLVARSEA